jgi:hypothetical protein
MPTSKSGSYDQITGARAARQPATGPGGIPLERPVGSHERLTITHDPNIPEPPTPDVTYYFQDTGEAVEPLERCPDRVHAWWRSDGKEWITAAGPRPSTAGRLKLERGERVIITRIERTTGTREEVRVATLADRKAHLAELEEAQRVRTHPRDGAHVYALAVPVTLDGIRSVTDVLEHLEARGIRPVRLGERLATARPGVGPMPDTLLAPGQSHRPPGDPERELLETWAPLILARLGGPAIGCDMDGCTEAADAIAMGGARLCRGHADTPVGETPPKRTGIRASLASAITAAVGG